MKATELYLPAVLFIMVQTFDTVDEILKCDRTIQMKATELYLPAVPFI